MFAASPRYGPHGAEREAALAQRHGHEGEQIGRDHRQQQQVVANLQSQVLQRAAHQSADQVGGEDHIRRRRFAEEAAKDQVGQQDRREDDMLTQHIARGRWLPTSGPVWRAVTATSRLRAALIALFADGRGQPGVDALPQLGQHSALLSGGHLACTDRRG